jgi:hypothetical protein
MTEQYVALRDPIIYKHRLRDLSAFMVWTPGESEAQQLA